MPQALSRNDATNSILIVAPRMRPYSQPDISYWELVQQLPSAPRWKRKPEVNSKTGERDGYQRTVIWRFEGGGSVPRKLEPWDVGWVEIE